MKLWEPSPERVERAAVTQFARSLGLPEDFLRDLAIALLLVVVELLSNSIVRDFLRSRVTHRISRKLGR